MPLSFPGTSRFPGTRSPSQLRSSARSPRSAVPEPRGTTARDSQGVPAKMPKWSKMSFKDGKKGVMSSPYSQIFNCSASLGGYHLVISNLPLFINFQGLRNRALGPRNPVKFIEKQQVTCWNSLGLGLVGCPRYLKVAVAWMFTAPGPLCTASSAAGPRVLLHHKNCVWAGFFPKIHMNSDDIIYIYIYIYMIYMIYIYIYDIYIYIYDIYDISDIKNISGWFGKCFLHNMPHVLPFVMAKCPGFSHLFED